MGIPWFQHNPDHAHALESDEDLAIPRREAGQGRRIVIIGAGPAGLLAAMLLRRRGYAVSVYEKRRDFRQEDPHDVHQSVGLSLMRRGIRHLLRSGLRRAELERCGVPVRDYVFVNGDRELVLPIGQEGEVLSLERRALIHLLIDEARAQDVALHFAHRLVDIDFQATRAVFETDDGARVIDQGEVIIGADGAHSFTRYLMQRRAPRFSYSQRYYERGWKTLTLADASKHGFDPGRIGFYGGEALVHAGFIPGDVLIFTACMPYQGPGSLAMTDPDEIAVFFARALPRLAACHPDIVAEFRRNPAGDFVAVECSQFHHGRVMLIGDSAHAMVPFLGQGMNCALEDAGVLHDLVCELDDDWDRIPAAFTRERKPDADAINRMSLEHYHVLDSSNPVYLARVGYLAAMHRRFPRLYPMDMGKALATSDIPFAELERTQERHNRWYRLGRM